MYVGRPLRDLNLVWQRRFGPPRNKERAIRQERDPGAGPGGFATPAHMLPVITPWADERPDEFAASHHSPGWRTGESLGLSWPARQTASPMSYVVDGKPPGTKATEEMSDPVVEELSAIETSLHRQDMEAKRMSLYV